MNYADITNPKTFTNVEQLHLLMAHMREHEPVAWIETPDHRPFWAISKHADIIEISRQSDKFLNAPRPWLMTIEAEQAAIDSGVDTRTLVHMDAPDHKLFRDITKDWFMPQNLKLVEQKIEAIAASFVDRMVEMGGECDFVKDVSNWYSLRVIMMILGVPEEDEALMLKLTQEIFGANDPDKQREQVVTSDFSETIGEFFAYFSKITADRRAHPEDDIASVIANARVNGEPLGDLETMSYYVLVATAGHDTVGSATSGALLTLLQHPEQLHKLRENPDLLPRAIDEAIRWITPTKHFMRTATEDYPLRGQTIRKDESVMLMYGSANRDEEVFEAAAEFRVDRRPNRHLAFGMGAHHCLGHLLAKMEMQALFAQMLDRLSSIELAGDEAWIESYWVTGLKSLPIRYTVA